MFKKFYSVKRVIEISTFDNKTFFQNGTSNFSLVHGNSKVLFFDDQFCIESLMPEEININFFQKIIKLIKGKIFNVQLSNDNLYEQQKNISIYFKNSNSKPYIHLSTNDKKELVYSNIYDGIDLKCTINEDRLICNFILSKNCNPDDVLISFNGNSSIALDENNNLSINLNNSNIIFKKPFYSNQEAINKLDQKISVDTTNEGDDEYKYVLDGDNAYLVSDEERLTFSTQDITHKENYDYSSIEIESEPIVFQNIPDPHFVGERNLTIPVSKTKFKYPRDYTTDLICSFNVPTINELLVDKYIKKSNSSYHLCDSSHPPVTVFAEYNVDTITPTVSYSVVLFKEPYPDTGNVNEFKNVFAYTEDYFIGDSFDICNTTGNEKYYPVDYTFVAIPDEQINYTSENEEYYFYSVTLQISIYPTPPIENLSSEVTTILNGILGKSPTDPITPGELSQIEVLDLNNIPSVIDNPAIFNYMPNLRCLYLSNCGLDDSFLDNLSTLSKLESLNLSGNLITNLNSIPNSLSNTLKCLDVSYQPSSDDPCSAYTSFSSVDVEKIKTVEPLEKYYSLEILKLDNQAISDLSSLYPLITDYKLKSLFVRNQEIDKEPIYPQESICSSSCDFSMKVDFLKNIDGTRPTILCISDDGYCWNSDTNESCYPCDSCDLFYNCEDSAILCNCEYIIWEDINVDTNAYFTFSQNYLSNDPLVNYEFSGTISVDLIIND